MLVAQKESFISSLDKEKGIVEDDPGKPSDKTERNHPPYGTPKWQNIKDNYIKALKQTTVAHHQIISTEIRWNNVVHFGNWAEDDRQKRFEEEIKEKGIRSN